MNGAASGEEPRPPPAMTGATAGPEAEADADAAAPLEPQRLHLHMPVNVRSASLGILAVLASLFALHAASAVFIPLCLGLAVSYALSPLVDRLERLRCPRALGAALLLGSIGLVVGWTAYSLADDANALIESLPAATQKLREAARAQRAGGGSTIETVQKAAAQLEQAAQEGATVPAPVPRGVTRVSVEPSRFDVKAYLWTGTLGLLSSIAQAVVVVFIAFFLMSSGNSFRRKMVKIAGPTFAQKRITVQMLDEITEQIHRYLLVQLFTSLLVGVVTWLALLAIGLDHAAVWGVVAFVCNFIPYLGTIAFVASSSLVAFVQFGSVNTALLVAGAAMLIHTLSGNLLTPWLTSRTSRMNTVTVFVGVLGFGWLWGVWGLLLGVPILTTVKAVCDRVDELKPIGELLSA